MTVHLLSKGISRSSKYLEIEPSLAGQKKAAIVEKYNEIANELRSQSVVALQAVVGEAVSLQQLEAALTQGSNKDGARIAEAHLKELEKPIPVKQGMEPIPRISYGSFHINPSHNT